jgi:hypothetical protein
MAIEIKMVAEKTDTDMKRLRQHMESEMRLMRDELKRETENNNETHISA